jgi:5-carboxymethyl-2-hydroxymuconate isomerase
MDGIPPNIASAEFRLMRFLMVGENPLLAESVFEVTDVKIRVVAIDDRRIATPQAVVVVQSQEWL